MQSSFCSICLSQTSGEERCDRCNFQKLQTKICPSCKKEKTIQDICVYCSFDKEAKECVGGCKKKHLLNSKEICIFCQVTGYK